MRHLLLFSIASLLPCLGLAQPTWPSLAQPLPLQKGSEGDAAVIVAIEDYLAVADVPGALNNADDWYRFFVTTRGIPSANVKLLRNRDGVREKILAALKTARTSVSRTGTLWFVFIGHGAAAPDRTDGVLVGYDAQQDPESLYARSVRQSEAVEAVQNGTQRSSVFLIDACFSGRTSNGALVAGLQPVIALRPIEPKGVTVLSAGSSDQFAGPLPDASRPAFSYLVLGALRGWGDRNRDGTVTLGEAVEYARSAIQTVVVGRSQTPELTGPNALLAVSGGSEQGPDLTAFALARRPPTPDAELSFSTAVEIRVPRISVAAGGSLERVNIQAELLLEQAQDASDAESSSPQLKADSWCRLAALKPDNPYAEQADEGCALWRTYARKLHERETRLAEDYQTLVGYLQLRRKTRDQKAATISAFLSSYGAFTSDPRVTAVRAAKKQLELGVEVQIQDQADAYAKACDGKDAKACELLGVLKLRGRYPFSQPDELAALGLFEKACEQDPRFGCSMSGLMRKEGRGRVASREAARFAFERGCRGGDASGCLALAPIEGGDTQSGDWLSKACEHGDQSSCVQVARAFIGLSTKVYGIRVDATRGVRLAERACRAEEANGCMAVGDSFRTLAGANDANPDGAFQGSNLEHAADAYEHACSLGNASGCSRAVELINAIGDKARQARVEERWCSLSPSDCLNQASAPVLSVKPPPVAQASPPAAQPESSAAAADYPSVAAPELTAHDPAREQPEQSDQTNLVVQSLPARDRTLGVSFVVAGGVLLVAGVGFHIAAASTVGQVRAGGFATGAAIGQKLTETQAYEVVGWVGLAGAVACGVVGLTDLLRGEDSKRADIGFTFVPSLFGIAAVMSGALP